MSAAMSSRRIARDDIGFAKSSGTPWVGFASSGMIPVAVEVERDATCRRAARDARLERGEQHD